MFGNDKLETKAVFVGADGSMGFRNGETYRITISIQGRRIWVECGMKECPYATMKALLKNWQF